MNTHLIPVLVMLQTWLTDHTQPRNERGSVSVEQAIISGAIAILAALVIAAIASFAEGKLALLGG